jgi:hypothetical protein
LESSKEDFMRPHLALVALVLCTGPAAALDLPARKAGLWELKMSFANRKLPVQTMEHCIDAETDKLMNSMGGAMRNDMCSKQDVQMLAGTIVVDSVCKIGPATTTSHAVVSGDFSSAYVVEVTSKREGPATPGMSPSGETSMTIAAKWLGACKADQKPGDIIMAGGRKMNVRDLQTLQSGAGGARPSGVPPQKK